jgi:hypothetical protein
MNIAEYTRTFEEYDDPYHGVIDYEYLLLMQERAILEAEMERELAEDYEADLANHS